MSGRTTRSQGKGNEGSDKPANDGSGPQFEVKNDR